MSLTIRKANIGDAAFLADGFLTAIHIDNCTDEMKRAIVDVCRLEMSLYSWKNAVVAEQNGHAVGCLIFYDGAEYEALRQITYSALKDFAIADLYLQDAETHAGEYYLDSLAVIESARHKGVASELLRAAIAEARKQNASAIALACDPENINALNLYHSLGFEDGDTIYIYNKEYRKLSIRL